MNNDYIDGLNMVREPETTYAEYLGGKKQGEYTVDDFEKLPEDQRMELIDGVLYDMAEPTTVHQMIVGKLHALLLDLIAKSGKDCVPFVAPCGVKLDFDDDKTIVEPDVFVVCDRSKISKKRIDGAPDLVIEVISPSSKKKDYYIKHERYARAKVREYWIVDIERERITVHDMVEDMIHLYTFDDTVPICISGGEMEVDFKEIKDHISFLL